MIRRLKKFDTRPNFPWRAAGFGALIGLLIIHPFAMVVHYIQFAPGEVSDLRTLAQGVASSLGPTMILMGLAYASLGLVVGTLYARYGDSIMRNELLRTLNRRTQATNLPSLIKNGESGDVEFKSSLRWDRTLKSVNTGLEAAVVKTIGGFMNGFGGVLLLGVGDDGTITGVEADYGTLKQANTDGLEQHIMHLVGSRLGVDACSKIDVDVHFLDGHDIGVVSVLPAARPVYVKRGAIQEYYLRTGNSTRSLNTPEAVAHIRHRFERS